MKRDQFLSVTAIILSIIAITLVLLNMKSESRISSIAEKVVYDRLVDEVWAELAPVYEDFEIDITEKPKTLRDALHPLIGIDLHGDPVNDPK